MEPAHAHVTLDLRVGATPIRGSFRRGHEHARQFEGWIELASLIDGTAHVPDRPAAGSPDTSGPGTRSGP